MSQEGLLDKTSGGGGRAWPWALAAAGFLLYFLWAGSSWDPRHTAMWTYSPDRWLVPAPGIPHFLAAGLLLGGAIMMLAARALACRGMRPVGKFFASGIILCGGLAVRLWVIHFWKGFDLTPAVLGARKFSPVTGIGRWAVAADMITLIFIVAAQWGKPAENSPATDIQNALPAATNKNVWLAAVYAFHPVALLTIARGEWLFAVLPAIVILAMLAPRLRDWVRTLLMTAAAVGCVYWLWLVTGGSVLPFNGAVPAALQELGIPAGSLRTILVLGAAAMETVVLLLAITRRWSVAKAWGHMLAVWAVFSPVVMPMDLLPMIALLPLAWVNASAILSVSVLLAYGITLSWSPGDAWALPLWLIFISALPVAVIELEELLREATAAMTGRTRLQPREASPVTAA